MASGERRVGFRFDGESQVVGCGQRAAGGGGRQTTEHLPPHTCASAVHGLCMICMRVCEPAGLLQLAADCSARLCRMLCRSSMLLHAVALCDVVRVLPSCGPISGLGACT